MPLSINKAGKAAKSGVKPNPLEGWKVVGEDVVNEYGQINEKPHTPGVHSGIDVPGDTLVEVAVTAKVSVTDAQGKTKETNVPLGTAKTPSTYPNVGVKMGHTKNLGNYESVRVDVSLYLPTHPEDLDSSFEFAEAWVDSKMSSIIDSIENPDKNGIEEQF